MMFNVVIVKQKLEETVLDTKPVLVSQGLVAHIPLVSSSPTRSDPKGKSRSKP